MRTAPSTAQQGGTVDLRLRSSTELEKAVTTIEYAAVVPTVNGTYKDDFGRTFSNMLDAPVTVDLASSPAPVVTKTSVATTERK